jgi:hypothetical protein
MNLKEISNKELTELACTPFLGTTQARTELLSRLEQVENLKCCGNCGVTKDCSYMLSECDLNQLCPEWESDNMTKEDRLK